MARSAKKVAEIESAQKDRRSCTIIPSIPMKNSLIVDNLGSDGPEEAKNEEKGSESQNEGSNEEQKNEDDTREGEGTKAKKPRRRFLPHEKEMIIDMYIEYCKVETVLNFGLKEGTLNTMVTAFNKDGEESFEDFSKKY